MVSVVLCCIIAGVFVEASSAQGEAPWFNSGDDDDASLLQTAQRLASDRNDEGKPGLVQANVTKSNETWEASRRGHKTKSIPVFNIDLNLPPEQRWLPVLQYYTDPTNVPDNQITTQWMSWVDSVLTPADKQAWISGLAAVVPEEYQREINFTLQYAETHGPPGAQMNMTFDEKFSYTLLSAAVYELNYPSTACSGNLVAMPNGTVIHGRNLDYAMSGGSLADSAYTAVFTQGDVPIGTAVMFLGGFGIHTGMRFGGWSFEQNTHWANNRSLNLQVLQQGGQLYSIVVRELMKNTATYQAAQAIIMATKFMAPSYFVMAGAGPWEGAIITADREVPTDLGYPAPFLSANVLSPSIGRWYFVQTNDELWGPPEDDRRFAEIANLENLGQDNATLDTVLAALRIPPGFNSGTVFTWSAIPATGAHKTAMAGESVPCILNTVPDTVFNSGACVSWSQ